MLQAGLANGPFVVWSTAERSLAMTMWAWVSVNLVLVGAICQTFSWIIHRADGGDSKRVQWLVIDDPHADAFLMPMYIFYSFLAMGLAFTGYVLFILVVL